MANQEHLDLIKQGIETWNVWRKEHPKTKVDLRGADLRGAKLIRADLSFVDLRDAKLIGADLSYADLSKAHFMGADFAGAHLDHVNLSYINLKGANLSGASLIGANLFHANLSHTNLSSANLNNASLGHADLSEADLSHANLSFVDLSEADLSFARIRWTEFGDRNLSKIKGLETVQHLGPSPLSINTIYLSEGDIPEAFVRGTGAPDSFIEYMHALAAKPIQYYTCFISYSSKDQDFVERLYADLQSNNVRCWYAPEDMKIGDKIRQRIDESIRMYDKLLLVLSQHSVMSHWVEKEVETAFEKEQRHNKLVLFPIMLDDTVMRTNQAWAADISRTRHIGDFTHWKEHDAYQRGLKKLLKDLKA